MTARRRRRPTRSHAHDMLVTFLYIYDNIQRYAVCVLYSRALRAIHTWWIEQNGDKGKVFLCSWFSFFFRLVTKTHGALYTYMYVFYTLTTYDFLTFFVRMKLFNVSCTVHMVGFVVVVRSTFFNFHISICVCTELKALLIWSAQP